MFEIVFEFCAMVFCIVTVSAWCIIVPMIIKIWIDDGEDDKKYREEMRKELYAGITSIEPKK